MDPTAPRNCSPDRKDEALGITEISEPKIVIYCGIYQNIKVKTYENNSPKYRKDKNN